MAVPQTEVLIFVEGQEIARHVLIPGTYVFGRSNICDVPVDAPLVSREHARIAVTETGSLLLQDVASTNGTFLDGEQINGPTPVGPNQTVQMGAAHLLVLQEATARDPQHSDPAERRPTSPHAESARYQVGCEIARGGMGAVLRA